MPTREAPTENEEPGNSHTPTGDGPVSMVLPSTTIFISGTAIAEFQQINTTSKPSAICRSQWKTCFAEEHKPHFQKSEYHATNTPNFQSSIISREIIISCGIAFYISAY